MTKYNSKTGKETKLFAAKQGPHPHKQWEQQLTTNQQQQNQNLRTYRLYWPRMLRASIVVISGVP